MANLWGLIKNFIMENIYSLLIGPIHVLISWMWSILKFLKNISIAQYWLSITAILQLSNNRILWHVNSYPTDNDWPDYKSKLLIGMRKYNEMVLE